MTIEVGTILRGTVVKVADYGAIVRLPSGSTGLVHISEVADTYVRDVRDYVNETDEITVKVLALNPKGRYELSIKQCGRATTPVAGDRLVGVGAARREQQPQRASRPEGPLRARPASFEDRLSRFLKDSEERQHDLKRNIESKRGRR